jgi:hypothetical protein
MNPLDFMLWYSFMLAAFLVGGKGAHANDLKQLYELALTRDTMLQVAVAFWRRRIRVRAACRASDTIIFAAYYPRIPVPPGEIRRIDCGS